MQRTPRSRRRPLPAAALSLLLLAGLASPAAANGDGGFRAGDVYLYNAALFGLSTGNGGVARVGATGAENEAILGPFGTVALAAQQLGYDPHRDRLVVGAFLDGTFDLWAVDADGNHASLGQPGILPSLITPTGDGRIYFRRRSYSPAGGIQYIDADGSYGELMDVTGTVPFELNPGFSDLAGCMIYEPLSSSLVIATHANTAVCPGGSTASVNFHRIPLSADGSKVAGPVECGQYNVDVSSGSEDPVGLSYLPGGKLLLAVDTNSALEQCRLLEIDPVTMTATPFACTNGFWSPALNAAIYAPTRGQAVVLDTGQDHLRAFSDGDVGEGLILPAAGVSPGGSSHEDASLAVIGNARAQFGLTAGVTELSLSAGGSQGLAIDFGPAKAGAVYWGFGSVTGWNPGFDVLTTHFPLNYDPYFDFTLTKVNTGVFSSSLGILDPAGQGAMSFNLPTGADPTLAGLVLHHCATTIDLGVLLADAASNAVAVELVP